MVPSMNANDGSAKGLLWYEGQEVRIMDIIRVRRIVDICYASIGRMFMV